VRYLTEQRVLCCSHMRAQTPIYSVEEVVTVIVSNDMIWPCQTTVDWSTETRCQKSLVKFNAEFIFGKQIIHGYTLSCILKCSNRKCKIVRPRISVKTETNSPSLSEMPIPRRQWNEIVRSRTRSFFVTSRELYFLSDTVRRYLKYVL